jgi:hypothetical protein
MDKKWCETSWEAHYRLRNIHLFLHHLNSCLLTRTRFWPLINPQYFVQGLCVFLLFIAEWILSLFKLEIFKCILVPIPWAKSYLCSAGPCPSPCLLYFSFFLPAPTWELLLVMNQCEITRSNYIYSQFNWWSSFTCQKELSSLSDHVLSH